MGGKLTFPGAGFYHASKHAVEAISDALRFEVRGFGVEVVVIEPGVIRTGFAQTAVDLMGEGSGPYAGFDAGVASMTRENYERGPLAALGGGPEAVAETIERAVSAARPRARYTVTPSARLLISTRRLLPDRVWDAVVGLFYPRPGG